MPIKIISDSSCDFSLEQAKKLDVEIVPFYVSFDSENYKKELVDFYVRDFYEKMVKNPKIFPKSSLPSIQDYVEIFTKYASQGYDIVCICITNKFSGSHNSALNAAEIVRAEYPNVKITAINSIVTTVLQGLLVKEVVRMRDNGLSYEEIVENTERIKVTGRIIFTIGDVDYLMKGGRIGKVLSGAVSKLHVMPIITMTDGEILPSGISHNRKSAVNKVIDKVKSYIVSQKINVDDYCFTIGYGYDFEEAVKFKEDIYKISKTFCDGLEMDINQIGSTIGVHTGPHPLGVGMIEKYDARK